MNPNTGILNISLLVLLLGVGLIFSTATAEAGPKQCQYVASSNPEEMNPSKRIFGSVIPGSEKLTELQACNYCKQEMRKSFSASKSVDLKWMSGKVHSARVQDLYVDIQIDDGTPYGVFCHHRPDGAAFAAVPVAVDKEKPNPAQNTGRKKELPSNGIRAAPEGSSATSKQPK